MKNTIAAFIFALTAFLPQTAASSPAPRTVLTAKDAAKPVKASVRQTFTVRLAANPSTGYLWQIAPETARNESVSVYEESFEHAKSRLAGAGGTAVFTVQMKKAGKTRVVLRYFRPWEHFDAAHDQSIAFVFDVK